MFFILRTTAADDLTMQGARATAPMVLTYISRNIPDSASELIVA